MELIKKLDMRFSTPTSKKKNRFGSFKCPECNEIVETKLANGLAAAKCKKCTDIANIINKTTHGGTNTPLYKIWESLRRKDVYHNDPDFMHDEWSDFAIFREYANSVGYEDGFKISLKNNIVGYNPDNCEFLNPDNEIIVRKKRRPTINSKHKNKHITEYTDVREFTFDTFPRSLAWIKQKGSKSLLVLPSCVDEKGVSVKGEHIDYSDLLGNYLISIDQNKWIKAGKPVKTTKLKRK